MFGVGRWRHTKQKHLKIAEGSLKSLQSDTNMSVWYGDSDIDRTE